jgi:hypothetical protein
MLAHGNINQRDDRQAIRTCPELDRHCEPRGSREKNRASTLKL